MKKECGCPLNPISSDYCLIHKSTTVHVSSAGCLSQSLTPLPTTERLCRSNMSKYGFAFVKDFCACVCALCVFLHLCASRPAG